MGWKEWPRWLRYGIIVFALVILSSLFYAPLVKTNNAFLLILSVPFLLARVLLILLFYAIVIIFSSLNIFENLINPLTYLLFQGKEFLDFSPTTFGLILTFVLAFLVGALIGWIVGKIRGKK